jgi:hypothetical protein
VPLQAIFFPCVGTGNGKSLHETSGIRCRADSWHLSPLGEPNELNDEPTVVRSATRPAAPSVYRSIFIRLQHSALSVSSSISSGAIYSFHRAHL